MTPSAGKVTIKLQCDQSATAYWAFAQSNSTYSSFNYTTIQAATLNKGVATTMPDKNNSQLVMGYVTRATANSGADFDVSEKTMASVEYFGYGVCLNLGV